MQYFGQPWGMWVLFSTSFERHPTQEFALPAKTAKAVTAKAGQTDRRLIADLPDFEKEDRFAMNIVNAAICRDTRAFAAPLSAAFSGFLRRWATGRCECRSSASDFLRPDRQHKNAPAETRPGPWRYNSIKSVPPTTKTRPMTAFLSAFRGRPATRTKSSPECSACQSARPHSPARPAAPGNSTASLPRLPGPTGSKTAASSRRSPQSAPAIRPGRPSPTKKSTPRWCGSRSPRSNPSSGFRTWRAPPSAPQTAPSQTHTKPICVLRAPLV